MSWTLVTGAAKRLGRTIALDLAAHGCDVVIHFNTSKLEASAVVDECRALGVRSEMLQGDFTTPASTLDFISRYQTKFPETKCLVNNVGNFLAESAQYTSDDDWTAMFQTNLHVPFTLTRELIPSLKRHRGCIVNLGFAGAGSYLGSGHCAAYSIAKSGLWMLTRALALDLAPHGVRVNMVSPGHLENTVVEIDDVGTLPMQRFGRLEEVARAVRFFIDDDNAYITGQNIEVAGGVRL